MTRTFILSAALLIAAKGASAQIGSAAIEKAKKAQAAENAHIEAEQRPDGPAQKQAAKPTAKPAATTSKQQAAPASKTPAGKAGAKGQPAAPDTATPPAIVYREAYDYDREGRRDPFISLLTTNELRPTMSDLRLTSIAFDNTGRRSIAILRDLTTNAQYRVTTGSALGRMRVSNIKAKTVVFTIDEFGTSRQDSLVLGDTTKARAK